MKATATVKSDGESGGISNGNSKGECLGHMMGKWRQQDGNVYDKSDGNIVRTNAGIICVRSPKNDGTNGGGSNGKSDCQNDNGNEGEVLENH